MLLYYFYAMFLFVLGIFHPVAIHSFDYENKSCLVNWFEDQEKGKQVCLIIIIPLFKFELYGCLLYKKFYEKGNSFSLIFTIKNNT